MARCFYIAWEKQIKNTNLNEITFDWRKFHQIFKAVYVRALLASENQILDHSFSVFWGDYLILKLMHNKFK